MPAWKGITGFVAFALLSLLACAATAADWTTYRAPSYGFSMLAPPGTAVREREWGGGWGGLYAEYEGVRLYGRARLGAKESDADIERYAVQAIGIPSREWRRVDAGTARNGWERYRTFEAVRGDRLFFGGYGVGPRGNYLLYMETTVADFNAHRADYLQWYDALRLD